MSHAMPLYFARIIGGGILSHLRTVTDVVCITSARTTDVASLRFLPTSVACHRTISDEVTWLSWHSILLTYELCGGGRCKSHFVALPTHVTFWGVASFGAVVRGVLEER